MGLGDRASAQVLSVQVLVDRMSVHPDGVAVQLSSEMGVGRYRRFRCKTV